MSAFVGVKMCRHMSSDGRQTKKKTCFQFVTLKCFGNTNPHCPANKAALNLKHSGHCELLVPVW